MIETEVLVVGAGPAGATAALALSEYRIANICLTKYRSPSPTPRAHIFNQRAMEILRHFGLENEAVALEMPQALMAEQVFCTSLAGPEIGRLKAWHNHPRLKAQHDLISPCAIGDLPQDRLEPMLVSAAMKRGTNLMFSTELERFEQDAQGVTAYARNLVTQEPLVIRAKYMIGADGSNSRVAEQLALPMVGKMGLGGSLGIIFRADLARFVAHRPGVMYWMVQPGRGMGGFPVGVLRAVEPWDRWVGTWGFDPSTGPPSLSDAEATAIVHRLVGDSSVAVEIEAISSWSINSMFATRLSAGRVLCVGDAIHRHTPMNGLGSNTSMQDSFNLAWKLALVLRGHAGPGLVATFEDERQPVAQFVVQRAFQSLGILPPLIAALGIDDDRSAGAIDEAIAGLAAPTSEGATRRAAVRHAVDAAVYGFSGLGAETNIVYRSTAVLADAPALSNDDPDLEAIIATEPGRRLAHVWLTCDGVQVSTLDLCARGGFTLFTGLAGAQWATAARTAGEALGVTIAARVVGPGARWEDPYGDFARRCLADETGALLVRPDQHVAWHASSMPQDPQHALQSTLRAILALD